MSQRSVVLVGPMGSGKSTVGRVLARRLGVGHVDTDDRVTSRARRSISEIFDTDGEDVFRALETEALNEALAGPSAVISTGGGVVVAEANRTVLTHAPALVVWLDASIEVLAQRVGAGDGRPLLAGDVLHRLEEKVAERAPGYAEVADLRVDTSSTGQSDCVAAIMVALEGRAP